jgi:hypothetical protein
MFGGQWKVSMFRGHLKVLMFGGQWKVPMFDGQWKKKEKHHFHLFSPQQILLKPFFFH